MSGKIPAAKGFVAVHIGAGYHSPANCELYENVCKQACQQAIALLKQRKTALDAVMAAIVSLENSQWTNAGLGSNLSLAGTVECDASIMDGKSLYFGAVGALSGVRNPILVAESLLRTQTAGEMSLGRVPPSTLVAHGAFDWAVRHKIPTCSMQDLMTDASQKAYIKNKRKLDMFEDGLCENPAYKVRVVHPDSQTGRRVAETCVENQNESLTDNKDTSRAHVIDNTQSLDARTECKDCSSSSIQKPADGLLVNNQDLSKQTEIKDENEARLADNRCNLETPHHTNGFAPDVFKDTVGAICVDDSGAIASAVSSGGIILKQPGRLGQAALYGCGCWAENDVKGKVGVGVSTSGCGEQLSKTLLAKACGECLKDKQNPTSALYDCFVKRFLESPYLRNEKQPLGGAVAVTVDSSNDQILDLEVLWAHTTDSMCIAFMSTNDLDAKAFVSRLPSRVQAGKAVVIQSENLTISSS